MLLSNIVVIMKDLRSPDAEEELYYAVANGPMNLILNILSNVLLLCCETKKLQDRMNEIIYGILLNTFPLRYGVFFYLYRLVYNYISIILRTVNIFYFYIHIFNYKYCCML